MEWVIGDGKDNQPAQLQGLEGQKWIPFVFLGGGMVISTAHFCRSPLFPNSLSRLTSSGDSRLTSPSPGLCFAWPLTLSPATSIQPQFCMSFQVQCCHHQTHTQLLTTTLQNFLEWEYNWFVWDQVLASAPSTCDQGKEVFTGYLVLSS